MKELVEKCKQQNEKSDKDLIDVMTCVEKNTKNQELIQNFVLPAKKSAELMLKIKSLPKDRQDIVEKYAMEDPRMAKEKAKKSASVIVPSMGMFKKLLDAYSIENERLGTWKAIGYDVVESSEFSFNQITKLDEFFGAFVVIEGVKATNLVELADCPALSSWIMRCGLNSEKEVVCECSIESENKDACAEIAPSFMRLCE